MLRLLVFCGLLTAAIADGPLLTDAQKVQIRDAQLQVASLDARKARLETEYVKVSTELEKASTALDSLVSRLTPNGYVMQVDLNLVPAEKK